MKNPILKYLNDMPNGFDVMRVNKIKRF